MVRHVNKRGWSAVIADFRRPGLTRADFFRRRLISVCAFRYRRDAPDRASTHPARRIAAFLPDYRNESRS